MIYDLKNPVDNSKAFNDVLAAAQKEDIGLCGFEVLFWQLNQAANSTSIRIELRQEFEHAESTEMRRDIGHLTSAYLSYDDNIHFCNLSLELDESSFGGPRCKKFSFTFDPLLTEENDHSNPVIQEKLYLYPAGCTDRVLVGVIFHFI